MQIWYIMIDHGWDFFKGLRIICYRINIHIQVSH